MGKYSMLSVNNSLNIVKCILKKKGTLSMWSRRTFMRSGSATRGPKYQEKKEENIFFLSHHLFFTICGYLYPKRTLIDSEQLMGAIECVMRTKASNCCKSYEEKQVRLPRESENGSFLCHLGSHVMIIQIAWIISVVPTADGSDCMEISNWHAWIDPVWYLNHGSKE